MSELINKKWHAKCFLEKLEKNGKLPAQTANYLFWGKIIKTVRR